MQSYEVWITLYTVIFAGGTYAILEQNSTVPKNPINDKDRRVVTITLPRQVTNIGSSFIVTNSNSSDTLQSCYVRTPTGLQYAIMDGFYIPGLELVKSTTTECSINITVLSEDMVGEWILISRGSSKGKPIEKRVLFTVYVEEIVSAFPESITVDEGDSIHVRLKNPTNFSNTCKLVGPSEMERHYEHDLLHLESCGFIIHNAQQTDNGEWHIIYGTKIIYRSDIEINVIERQRLTSDRLMFIRDTQVSLEFGPEDAVYCKIEDPTGLVIFDGFGKCNIVLERVTMEHHGCWKMYVGRPEQVFVTKERFLVIVNEAEPKAAVSTRLISKEPTVVLICSVNSPHQVRTCLFRNPKGEIRIAAQGTGEDRYISQNSQVSYESYVHGQECGLRITEPTSEDLGLWRCAIETEGELMHYGFLKVLCPWLMQDPEIRESVITEPVLSSDRTSVTSVEGDATTMSCSVQASIKYCYFRAQNGTVFSVTPATSSSTMMYVGKGFDAGECGIRVKNLQPADSGQWSCHVGLVRGLGKEQRSQIHVTIKDAITVTHHYSKHRGLLLEASVNGNRQLEYCRFVRCDGLGFTTHIIPAGYKDLSSLENGFCLLYMEESTILNRHPWTVAVKLRGQDMELSSLTKENLLIPYTEYDSRSIYVWITISVIGLILLLLGYSFGSMRNVEWIYNRFTILKNTIKNIISNTRRPEIV